MAVIALDVILPMYTGPIFQIKPHSGHKVFNQHVDKMGCSQLLAEVITTGRDFTALIGPLTLFEQQLSHLHKPWPRKSSMASRRVLPTR